MSGKSLAGLLQFAPAEQEQGCVKVKFLYSGQGTGLQEVFGILVLAEGRQDHLGFGRDLCVRDETGTKKGFGLDAFEGSGLQIFFGPGSGFLGVSGFEEAEDRQRPEHFVPRKSGGGFFRSSGEDFRRAGFFPLRFSLASESGSSPLPSSVRRRSF